MLSCCGGRGCGPLGQFAAIGANLLAGAVAGGAQLRSLIGARSAPIESHVIAASVDLIAAAQSVVAICSLGQLGTTDRAPSRAPFGEL